MNIGMVIFVMMWFIPSFALLISSFRESGAISSSGWWMIFTNPGEFTLANYELVLGSSGIGRAFLNTLIIALPATILTVILGAVTAFPIAYYKFPGRISIFILFIALQIIPIQITLIPVMKLLKSFRLTGTFPGVWLAHTAYGLPFAVYLMRNFFGNIPYSLLESARIDGAGRLQIFIKLILPLAKPAIASLAIFQFLWVWNDLLVSLVYLGGSSNVAPLTVKISSMMGSLESGWHIKASAAFISMLLPLALFFSLKKYFVKGVLAGSVKG